MNSQRRRLLDEYLNNFDHTKVPETEGAKIIEEIRETSNKLTPEERLELRKQALDIIYHRNDK